MATTYPSFPRLQISCLEGRAHGTRHKQAQFQSLHEKLKNSSDAIKAAITADSGHTTSEVEFEFSLALSELRLHFNSLNLQTELAIARKIEAGHDNIGKVRPAGIVYILPQKQNLFYSVISPLCAAIAAGNCVVVEVSLGPYWNRSVRLTKDEQLPQTVTQVSSRLRKILPAALDADTIAISEGRPPPDFMNQCLVVVQADEEKLPQPVWGKVLRSPSSLRTAAVVDRTSNIEEAARAIASSKLSFCGRSAYSPDLVLVNEFIAEQFLAALVTHVAGPMTRTAPSKNFETKASGKAEKVLRETEKSDGGRIVLSGVKGSIIEVQSR